MSLSKNKAMANVDLSLISKAGELKSRILFTILVLLVYRFGSYVPIPGVDPVALNEVAAQNADGILGIFNVLSGGSLGRMTIFALAIMPYITSSIIVQLLTSISKTLEAIKKEGEQGRRRINQYTRIGTVLLSIIQGFGIIVGIEGMSTSHGPVVPEAGMFFRAVGITTLVCGTIFLMWLGEQISSRGIGNGTSLIIFSGIVAGLPGAFASIFELARTGAMSGALIGLIALVVLAVVAGTVFVEKSHRKILVQYPKRQVGNKVFGGESSHIPLKINTAGVIPPIFASSILLFPLTIAKFSTAEDSWLGNLVLYLGHGKPLYIICYIALIMSFSFFYTGVIFNPEETAENLRKNGGFLPGRKPGKQTAEYLDYVLTRITFLGGVYLSILCVLPEIFVAKFSVPFYLGGTSILIVVNVVIDTVSQVQTHLFSHQYERLIKNSSRIRGR